MSNNNTWGQIPVFDTRLNTIVYIIVGSVWHADYMTIFDFKKSEYFNTYNHIKHLDNILDLTKVFPMIDDKYIKEGL